jgi:hypothetical protein
MNKKRKILYKCLIVLFTYLLLELTCFIFIKTGYIPARLPTFHFVSENDFTMHLIINKDWGVWHKPGQFSYQDGCLEMDNLYNSYGARDKERVRTSTDSNRVILLGDSFVEGFGVKENDRFSNLLEKETGKEMMNFSCNSFSPLQAVMMYKNFAKQYNHNTIIFGILPFNDFVDDDIDLIGNENAYRPFLVKLDSGYSIKFTGTYNPADTFINRSKGGFKERTVRFLKAYTCWYNIISYLKLKKAENKKMRTGTAKIPSYYYDYTPSQMERLEQILKDLRKSAIGKRIIVFSVPVVQDFLRIEKEKNQPPLPEDLRKICSQNNIEFMDLLDPIRATGKNYRDFYFYCDPHWNENGHKLVADILKKQYLKTPGSP